MRGKLLKKEIIFGIIILLISTSVIPGLSRNTNVQTKEKNIRSTPLMTPEKTSSISMYVFGKAGLEKHDIMVSSQDATQIYTQFQELNKELTAHPLSEKTRQLEQQFLSLLKEKNVILTGVSKEELLSLLQPPMTPPHNPLKSILPFQGKASEWRCSFISQGTGSMVPIIILPRLIPILLTPIPRVLIRWNVKDGFTSCGGLHSGTGFIAYGEQKGFAVGFWGIGLTFSLPPIMNFYGLAGYAFYASVSADYIEHYPPNNPPEITQTDPTDGQQMVPISTSELRFSIKDDDGDLMSYTVTTNPDIGSGSGGLKPDGVYSIPISELESLTQYTWHISVTDGKDTTEKTLTFTTEPVAPIVSNPVPANGERDVPMDIPQLQFTLKDYQGDAMEYTVQTSPNIGSDHKIGVHDGTYTVPVSGLTYGAAYRWFVNATDGTHWTRKVFSFETGYPSQFDPFEFGWHYRKQITINHTQVAGNLENFPVLIDTIDPDLMKARANGGDFLFMNGAGVASKLYHDLDLFEQSTGTLVAWVKIPQLSSETDTMIYLYYGNPSSLNMSYPAKVWGEKYETVYHLSESPTTPVHDSSGNNNNGVAQGSMTSSDLIQGKVGTCYSFDGIDDFISFDDFTSSLNLGACSAWVQTMANGPMAVWGEGSSSSTKPYLQLGKGEDGELSYARDVYGTDSNFQGRKEVGMNDGAWHYIVWSSSGTSNHFFFDGVEVMLNWQDGQNPGGIWFNDQNTDTTSLGVLHRSYNDALWDGLLDEIHISNVPFSAHWIATEYANQNNPEGFYTIGPEVQSP